MQTTKILDSYTTEKSGPFIPMTVEFGCHTTKDMRGRSHKSYFIRRRETGTTKPWWYENNDNNKSRLKATWDRKKFVAQEII